DWDRLSDGAVADVVTETMTLALRVAGLTLFGADLSDEAGAVGPAFRTAFAHVSHVMRTPFLPAWLPTPGNRRFARAKRVLDGVVLEMIAARRRSGERRGDLLDLLLAARDEGDGGGMTDEQLKDEALTLLTAGHETIGAALAWAWYLLGRHPDVQERMHAEVRGALGGRAPTVEGLPHLPLTRAVFDET